MAARTATAGAPAAPSATVSTLGAAVLAMAIGVGVIWIAGFAQAHALHAAAHDTRHATGFPCH